MDVCSNQIPENVRIFIGAASLLGVILNWFWVIQICKFPRSTQIYPFRVDKEKSPKSTQKPWNPQRLFRNSWSNSANINPTTFICSVRLCGNFEHQELQPGCRKHSQSLQLMFFLWPATLEVEFSAKSHVDFPEFPGITKVRLFRHPHAFGERCLWEDNQCWAQTLHPRCSLGNPVGILVAARIQSMSGFVDESITFLFTKGFVYIPDSYTHLLKHQL